MPLFPSLSMRRPQIPWMKNRRPFKRPELDWRNQFRNLIVRISAQSYLAAERKFELAAQMNRHVWKQRPNKRFGSPAKIRSGIHKKIASLTGIWWRFRSARDIQKAEPITCAAFLFRGRRPINQASGVGKFPGKTDRDIWYNSALIGAILNPFITLPSLSSICKPCGYRLQEPLSVSGDEWISPGMMKSLPAIPT